MAATIGVSVETVRRRVQQMVESGALQFDVNVSAEALGMPVQALINTEVIPDAQGNDFLSMFSTEVRVIRFHQTITGEQIYEIGASDIPVVSGALAYLRGIPSVKSVTVTFLYPNGDHKI